MAFWTNAPTGGTVKLDHNFSTILATGMVDPYNTAGLAGSPPSSHTLNLGSDASEPVSPSSCMVSSITAGNHNGGTQLEWHADGVYDSMYVGKTWRTNAGFEGRPQGNKTFFMRGPGTNGCFLFNNAALSNGSGTFIFLPNTGGLINPQITGSTDPGTPIWPNVGNGTVSVGTWYTLEAYIKRSASINSQDGILRWWINGNLVGNYTNFNYPGGLNEWVWSETWDGFPNFTVTRTWEHYVGHLYIVVGGSTTAGGTGGGGGGTTTPPVQVVLQSMTPANASIVAGSTRQYTITLSGATPTAISMFVHSSNTAAVTVPASVTIAANASSVVFTATAVAVGASSITTSYNGVNLACAVQVTAATTPGANTTFTYLTDFSGTQGSNQWYYLEENNLQMTYNGGTFVWSGSDLGGGGVQTIWESGFHPGASRGSKVRWVSAGVGSVAITGAAYDLDTGGGNGATFQVLHNGSSIFTRVIANGQTTGGAYNLTETVANGDTIEFQVTNTSPGDYSFNSTNLDPVIVFTATSGGGTTPIPEVPTAVVDLIPPSGSIIAGVAFTMTVRVSKIVTVDTAVVIAVGSASILTAPSSVTVPIGANEKTFSVTPLVPGTVAIDAVLNGTKRVVLTILPSPSSEPELPPPTVPVDTPVAPLKVQSVKMAADGALVTLTLPAKALAVKYDAAPTFAVIGTFPFGTQVFQHRFTWPSGTTFVCYRAQDGDGTWTESQCVPAPAPPKPPQPQPRVNKAVVDKYGVRWGLTGKGPVFQLKRNGSSVDHMYGLTLRKSGTGLVEVLQSNGVWLRRNGDAWEFVE